MTTPMSIRILGDPVLRQRATEVEEIDGRVAALCDRMLEVMYEAPGVGLAAPQVGVRKRIFVFDVGDGPSAVVNPQIVESDGEWTYEEGCLSVPGLSFEIVRPRRVHLRGWDPQGREVDVEADDLLARVFQHELDHLDGVLLLDRLEEDERKAAMKRIRELELTGGLKAVGRDAGVSRGRRL